MYMCINVAFMTDNQNFCIAGNFLVVNNKNLPLSRPQDHESSREKKTHFQTSNPTEDAAVATGTDIAAVYVPRR